MNTDALPRRIKDYVSPHIAVLLFLIVPLLASATETSEAPSSSLEPFTVGVLYWSMNIPGQVAMRQGLEDEAKRINARTEITGKRPVMLLPRVAGDDDAGIERQIAQMNALVQQKVDLIIVQPTDNAALAGPLRTANEAGVPVVAYDQYISGGELASYLTSDNYLAGFLDGEYVASLFPDYQEVKIVLVEYPHVSSTVERVNGFLDALEVYDQSFRVLKSYEAVEPVGGKKAGMNILKDFPEKGSIHVVFAVNDGGALAVVDTLANAGRGEIMVASIDGDPEAVKNIAKNRLTVVDSAQFCGPLGAEAMKTAYRILLGEKVPKHALLPVFPITKETLDLYPGWLGPIPQYFKKPWVSHEPFWMGKVKTVSQ